MKLSKVNLGNLVAVGHEDETLGLLIDRGNEVEYLEISAPTEAYEGLKQVDSIANQNAIALPPTRETQKLLKPSQTYLVESTMATAIAYDENTETLQVEFVSGSVYHYDHVDPQTWEDLCESSSVGQFYNARIKGNYSSTRIEKDVY